MKYINENYNTIEVSEGGWRGWARFNKTTGKELERRSNKTRKAEKNKAIQVRRFGDIEVAPDAVRAQEEYPPGAEADMNKLYKHKTPSAKTMDAMYKDHKKSEQQKRNAAKLKKVNMVGQSSPNNEAYDDIKKRLQDRSNKVRDAEMAKKMNKVLFRHRDMKEADGCWDGYKKSGMKMKGKKLVPNCIPEGQGAAYMPQAGKGKTAERELTSKAVLKQLNRNRNKAQMKGKTEVPHIRYVQSRDKSTDLIRPEKRKKRGGKRKVRKEGYNLLEASPKMTQLLRMGLAKKGELHTMLRAIKRGPDAMKDPKLRTKLYELLGKLVDIIEKDGQIFVKVRQNVQNNRKDLQAVEEMLTLEGVIIGVNKSFEQLNITEDMSGMSVSSGHKRSVAQGAGMTKKGVAAYRRRNPGSKLKTAVTTPPSKLKPGSKAANRRKAFCSRSRSWTSERGKAARRRWNC
tara:strand:+ start:129 stop:1499 length:1371 start_codon:yes stop_codon:yes gene_type:complete